MSKQASQTLYDMRQKASHMPHQVRRGTGKILSLLMSIILVCGLLPTVSQTQDAYAADGNVSPNAYKDVIIGEGTDDDYFPMDSWYKTSTVVSLYTADELRAAGAEAGNIAKVAFDLCETDPEDGPISGDLQIYMENTTRKSVDADTLSFTDGELTKVYDAWSTFGEETGWEEWELEQDFSWDGQSNLIVVVCHSSKNFAYLIRYNNTHITTGEVLCADARDDNNSNYADPYKFGSLTTSKFSNDYRPNIKLVFGRLGFHDVTCMSTAGGTIDTDCGDEVERGTFVTVTAHPDEGYTCTGVSANDGAVNVMDNGDGTYAFEMPDDDVVISATFAMVDYNITAAADPVSAGTIDVRVNGQAETSANFGDDISVSVDPAFGYDLLSVDATYVDAQDISHNITLTPVGDSAGGLACDYTFSMPAGSVVITAHFARSTYEVSLQDTDKVSISMAVDGVDITDNPAKVANGSIVTLTTQVQAGLVFNGILLCDSDGVDIGEQCGLAEGAFGVWTFTMPVCDVAVIPLWETLYTIDVVSEPDVGGEIGVTVNGVPAMSACAGDAIKLVPTAGQGYVFGSLTVNGTALESDTDGSFTFSMPTRDVSVVVTWLKLVSEDMFSVDVSGATYTAEPIEKQITSTSGLVRDVDYSVSYEGNTNVGTAKITIEGIGAYTGYLTYEFGISPARAVIICGNATKTFGEADPEFTYEIQGLLKDSDSLGKVSLTRKVGEDVGTYAITATCEGNANYDVVVNEGRLTIARASIAGAYVSDIYKQYDYTGSAITPVPSVSVNGVDLVQGTDFAVAYNNNTGVGTATITIMGLGNYDGTAEVTFEIVDSGSDPDPSPDPDPDPTPSPDPQPTALSDPMFEVDTHWEIYNGVPITKSIKGTDDDKNLVEGVDYTVTYADNDHADKGRVDYATITIEGMGDYTGVLTYSFAVLSIFDDVWPYSGANNWYFDAVYSLAALEVITRYGSTDYTIFGVGDKMMRCDLVTMLWRYCEPDEYAAYDESTAVNETDMADVPDHSYYTGAVNWAAREGVVTGNLHEDGAYTFDPNNSITFEQMITIVARYVLGGVEAAADYPSDALYNGSFTDADAVDEYARGAFGWAINNKVVTGNDNGDGTWTLAPLEDVARERVATVVWRAIDTGLL